MNSKIKSMVLASICMLPTSMMTSNADAADGSREFIRYNISRYPHGGRSCNDVVAPIAKRFTESTGKTVDSWTCDRGKRGTFDIVIYYISDERLRLETTWHASQSAEGTYKTADECTGAYDSCLSQFKRVTGLTPIIAYCFREDYAENSNYPFVMRIDSFGDSRMHYYGNDILIGAGQNELSQEFIDGIVAGLKSVDAEVVRVFLRTDPYGTAKLSMNYYDDLPVNLRLWMGSFYDNFAVCESQRLRALPAAKAAGLNPLASACVNDEFGTLKLTMMHFYAPQVVMEPFPKLYDTLAECEANLDNVIADGRVRMNWDLSGGFCAQVGQRFHVMAFRKKPLDK